MLGATKSMFDNPIVTGTVAGLIATTIWAFLNVFFKRFFSGTGGKTKQDKKVLFFAVTISSVVFIFGCILQPALQDLFDPENSLWWVLKILRDKRPDLLILLLFVSCILPGIVTGVFCVKGRTLNQRIIFAAISAVVSLSILDSISFFYARNTILKSGIPELIKLSNFGQYYFSLLSNILGGPIAGLIVGYVTHLYITANKMVSVSKY